MKFKSPERMPSARRPVLQVLLAVCFITIATGCASLQVSYDYDRKADFIKLKKFDWFEEVFEPPVKDLMAKRIKNEVLTQLKAKGIQQESEGPDFLVRFQTFGRPVYGGSTGVGFSVGVPVGGSGAMSVGSGTSRVKEKLEWTMALDFLNPNDRSVIWHATATDTVNPKMSPAQQDRLVHEAVSKMLSHFPPKNNK